MSGAGTPAGWYPDPQSPAQERYWDGVAWGNATRPAGGDSGGFAPPVAPGYGAPVYGTPGYGAAGYGYGAPGGPPPDNYLVWAILSTLLCCLPLGIVSIVKSSEVSSKWAMGDVAGAQKSSEDAKRWAIISALTYVALGVLGLIFFVIVGALAEPSNDL